MRIPRHVGRRGLLGKCPKSSLRVIVLTALVSATAGCAGGSRFQEDWGATSRLGVGWSAVGKAALTAAKDPFTWAPAIGAVVVQIGDLDNEIADWANEETPLFGSRQTAEDASDWMRAGTVALYLGVGLAAPVSQADTSWWSAKAKGFAVGGGAILATVSTTQLLKDTTDRLRPNEEDRESFPSGHASSAAISARLASDTLRYYRLSQTAKLTADVGLVTLAGLTGWARVEAAEHHPADILAGAALGNFFAVLATETFLRHSLEDRASLTVNLTSPSWVQLHLAF